MWLRASMQGRLEDGRLRRLDGLGFVWDPAAARWEQRCRELQAFAQQHGHTRVPKAWQGSPALAVWVDTVRARWRNTADPGNCSSRGSGKLGGLTVAQEARLRALGFDFGRHRRWEEHPQQRPDRMAGRGLKRLSEELLAGGSRFMAGEVQGVQEDARLLGAAGHSFQSVVGSDEDRWRAGLAELDAFVERRGFMAAWAHLHLLGPGGLTGVAMGGAAGGGSAAALVEWFRGRQAQAAEGQLPQEWAAALEARGMGVDRTGGCA